MLKNILKYFAVGILGAATYALAVPKTVTVQADNSKYDDVARMLQQMSTRLYTSEMNLARVSSQVHTLEKTNTIGTFTYECQGTGPLNTQCWVKKILVEKN